MSRLARWKHALGWHGRNWTVVKSSDPVETAAWCAVCGETISVRRRLADGS